MSSASHDRLRKCPVCKATAFHRPTRARGFWETRIFTVVGLRPFRCAKCGARFLRFSHQGDPPPEQTMNRRKKRQPADASEFLPAEDDRNFEELIRDIRAAERKKGLGRDEISSRSSNP